jgi:hypothetical protein
MGAAACRGLGRRIGEAGFGGAAMNEFFSGLADMTKSTNRSGHFCRLVMLSVLAAVATGCGTAEYERRIKENLDNQLVESVFTDLYDKAEPIPGTNVQLRIPKYITRETAKAFNEISPDPSGAGKIDPRRVQPPSMKLPGLKVTYEMTVADAPGGPLSYYLYLGAMAPGEAVPGGGTLADSLQQQLMTAFPASDPKPQWIDVEFLTPSTAKIAWKRIQANGDQEFSTGVSGEFKSVPGKIILYVYETQGQHVLIGWRVPKELEKQAKADGLSKVMGGTVEIGGGQTP